MPTWLLMALSACTGGEAGHGGPGGGPKYPDGLVGDGVDDPAPPGDFDPSFEDRTWSFDPASDNESAFLFSISEGDGLTDCGLGLGTDVDPVFPARQIFGVFEDPDYEDCPGGLHAIEGCDEYDGMGAHCVVYREWDADGHLTANVLATSGAMKLTDRNDGCKIELELSFPGGTFKKTATVPYDGGGGPYCLQ